MTKSPAFRVPLGDEGQPRPAFGEHLIADAIIAYNSLSTSVDGEAVALFIRDIGAGTRELRALRTKGAQPSAKVAREFIGPWSECKFMYTDGSKELEEMCEILTIPQDKIDSRKA